MADDTTHEHAADTAREHAAKGFDAAKTPLMAAIGAGEYAVAAVTKAVTDAAKAVTDARARAADGGHPHRMTTDEVHKLMEDMRAQAEKVYGEFAARGEQAWEHMRTQPQWQQAVSTLKAYTDKLDAHVESFVGDAREAGEKALGTMGRQTRSAGERLARTTERFGSSAARSVADTSRLVADTGAEVADAIAETGADLADHTRNATARAAGGTAPAGAKDDKAPES